MIRGLAFSGTHYRANAERVGSGYLPCVICGKEVRKPYGSVRVHEGGNAIVSEAEAEELNRQGHDAGDMYGFPIGRDCVRRHPEVAPYVIRG